MPGQPRPRASQPTSGDEQTAEHGGMKEALQLNATEDAAERADEDLDPLD
jgi:hypothetical protein